jgi:hypothetical protein
MDGVTVRVRVTVTVTVRVGVRVTVGVTVTVIVGHIILVTRDTPKNRVHGRHGIYAPATT